MTEQQVIYTGGKRRGKINAMAMAMIPDLLSGVKVAVLGCKDPEIITGILKTHGVVSKSTPAFSNETQIGFTFYCN